MRNGRQRSSKFRTNEMEIVAVAKESKNPAESDLLRSGKEGQPIEIDQISLSFKPDKRKVLIADKALIKNYRKHVPTSKYIYFVSFYCERDLRLFVPIYARRVYFFWFN